MACPPAGPSPPVVDLLIATADLQQDLISWKIRYQLFPFMDNGISMVDRHSLIELCFMYKNRPSKGKVDAKDLFHPYIELWVQERRLNLLEYCKLDKVDRATNALEISNAFLC